MNPPSNDDRRHSRMSHKLPVKPGSIFDPPGYVQDAGLGIGVGLAHNGGQSPAVTRETECK